MSLRVWLPLNGNINNQGYNDSSFSIVASNTSVSDSGKIGKCYTNNSNSSGGIISSQTIDIGTEQSMFCWFKFTSLESSSSLGGGLVTQHRYSKNTGMGITIKYVSSTTGYLSVNTGNGSSRTYNTYCGTTLLQANTWYHGGFTYDGSNILKIYVNGNCEYTGNIGQMSCPSDYLAIFSWSFQGSSGASIHADYKLNGSINDVRVYDHCLSAKEVKELSKGLVAHYPLDNNGQGNDSNYSDINVYDTSGYGNHGQIQGTLSYSSDSAKYQFSTVFTGSLSNYISAPPLPAETKTISCWLKCSTSSNMVAIADLNSHLGIGTYGNSSLMTYCDSSEKGSTGSVVLLGNNWKANEWNHVVAISTGEKTREVWLNGVQLSPSTVTDFWTHKTNTLMIGRRSDARNPFNGSLSDFRAYITVLSADDIKELYEVGASVSRNGAIFANEFKEVTE